MPRARLPYARLLASADYPLLPFLAPRSFVESPINSISKHNEPKRRTRQEEKEKKGACQAAAFSAQQQSMKSGRSCTSSRSRCEECSRSTFTDSVRSTWTTRTRPSLPISNTLRSRYVGISDFARRQVRNHATEARALSAEERSSQTAEYPMKEYLTQQRPSTVEDAKTVRSSIRRSPRSKTSRVKSSRVKALELEKFRLGALKKARGNVSEAELMMDGDYRSIRRRIINLVYNTAIPDLGSTDVHRKHLATFAALDRNNYISIRKHAARVHLPHQVACSKLTERVFRDVEMHDARQVFLNWMGINADIRKAMFTPSLIYLLDKKPGYAMVFVKATAKDPQLRNVSGTMIADALGHLSRLHKNGKYITTQGWLTDATKAARDFGADFIHIYRRFLMGHNMMCSQDLLYNVGSVAKGEDLRTVFRSLVAGKAFMGFDTMLHYASVFARAGDTEYALRCLQVLKADFTDTRWAKAIQRERVLWTCALILRRSMTVSKNYHETPNIVAAFVELGIRMDLRLYNIVIHNAMDAGDYTTAFKVYNTLESNQLRADRYTHSILLHGCAMQDNPAMFSTFAAHCAEIALETQDPWLAASYIHYVYMRCRDDTDKTTAVDILMRAYKRFFDPDCLGLIWSSTDGVDPLLETDRPRLAPPPVALYFMLQTAISSASTTNPQHVRRLYERFKLSISQEGESPLAVLARDRMIWNTFLHAFCKQEQYGNASQVIKDMTDYSVQPNVYSWNIFMQGFFKTGQVQAAERVFEIMRTKGIDPDQYTYGVMVRGYAKAQLVERVGEVMQEIENEGELDPDLLTALSRLVDREGLVVGLEKARKSKERQTRTMAGVLAAEEKERWTSPFEDEVKSLRHRAESKSTVSNMDSNTPVRTIEPSDSVASAQDLPSELAQPLEGESDNPQVKAEAKKDVPSADPKPDPNVSIHTIAQFETVVADKGSHGQPVQQAEVDAGDEHTKATQVETPEVEVDTSTPTVSTRETTTSPNDAPQQRTTSRPSIDLEAQYRQLQEQLGLTDQSSTPSTLMPDTPSPPTSTHSTKSAPRHETTSKSKLRITKINVSEYLPDHGYRLRYFRRK